MKPKGKLLLLDRPSPDDPAIKSVREAARTSSFELRELTRVNEETYREDGESPDAILIGRSLDAPLATARSVRRLDPSVQLLFLTCGENEAELKKRLLLAPMLGGSWRILNTSAADLGRELMASVTSTRQSRRFRTTLNGFKSRLAEATPSASEIRTLPNRFLEQLAYPNRVAFFLTDDSGIVTSWNRECRELFGRSDPEAIGIPARTIVGGDIDSGIARIRQPNGTERIVDLVVFPAPEGKAWVVTERHREFRSQEAHAFLSAIVSSTEDAVIGKTLDGIVVSWNSGAERLFGWRAEDVIGKPILIIIPDNRAAEHESILERNRSGKVVDPFRTTRKTRDGRIIPVSMTVSPVRDGQNRIIGASAILRDVTNEVRMEAALRESELRKAAMLASSMDGIVTIDQSGSILEFNPAAERVFGWPANVAIGLSLAELILPGHERDVLKRQLASGANGRLELEAVRRSGDEFPMEASLIALSEIQPPMYTIIFRDQTNRKAAEEEVRRRTEELSRSNQELEQFAYVASHDLKSPLRAIGQLAEWIEEDLADTLIGKSREYMDVLKGRVCRLEKLLEDILAYSRAGRKRGIAAGVDVRELLLETYELTDRPAAFTLKIGEDMPKLHSVVEPLQRVFRNLIENAIKHHDRKDGHLEVTSETKGKWVIFRFVDDGPGIDPRFRDKAFQMFQTLHPRDTVEGSGMGLAIVRKTIEAVGGGIELEESEGRGAAFRFSWPASMKEEGHE